MIFQVIDQNLKFLNICVVLGFGLLPKILVTLNLNNIEGVFYLNLSYELKVIKYI